MFAPNVLFPPRFGMAHSSRRPERRTHQPRYSVLICHQPAFSHLQPPFFERVDSPPPSSQTSSWQPTPQAFTPPQSSPESQPICGPTSAPFSSISPGDSSSTTGGRASSRHGRSFLHQLLQAQICPGRHSLSLGGARDAKGGVLVGHHVVFVLGIGRLVAIRHVDEIVRQLWGAVEVLSNAQRREGFSVGLYGLRGDERERRGGGV